LTLEKLAEEADVDVVELVAIEDDSHHKPEVRTVYQLANYFRLPRANLLQVAGLTAPGSGARGRSRALCCALRSVS
jgi:DNA-binding XRE family transcriptional regulator